jgi:hypothetical protein
VDDDSFLYAQMQRHPATFAAHIDAIYVCPHRKPDTVLLAKSFRDYPEATRFNSVMIGRQYQDRSGTPSKPIEVEQVVKTLILSFDEPFLLNVNDCPGARDPQSISPAKLVLLCE